jgi:UDP-N-acetylmuramoylalanine--D-glutamate ligase
MKLVILGSGESGVGTAILAQKLGYEVFVSDRGVISESYMKVLDEHQIDYESGVHSENKILDATLVMKSPGIPNNAQIVQQCEVKGIKIVSEIEFAAPHTNATIIAITGSNGKTTTTMIAYHLLKSAGYHVGLAGNIGQSFAWQVATQNFDYYVLEISSFQLDHCYTFKPHIAILTNITPDHLDRYNYQFDLYADAKFKITQNQTANDYFIYDADDENIANGFLRHEIKAQKIPFSVEQILEIGAFSNEQKLNFKLNTETFTMNIKEISIEGKHNQKNTMAASSAASLLRIRKESIRQSMQVFQGVEHRLEKVAKINDVVFINDSKATNVNSVQYALDSIQTAVVLIMGGVDKGNDYDFIMPLVREKVKAIVCLGIDNAKIIHAFGNVVDVISESNSMNEAVRIAYSFTEKGDTVLLSPACASFDLFKNYEDRGNQFKEAIKNL